MAFKMKGFNPGDGTGMGNKQKRISKFKGLDMTNREKRITNKMSKAEKAGKYQKSDKLQEKLDKIRNKKFKKAKKNVKVPEVVFNTPPSSFKIKTGNKIDGKKVKKTDTDRIEGEILGIYDNEYNEAKQDKDLKKIKQLEKRMLKLRNIVVKRGDGELFTKNKSHIDMSKFNSPNKMKGNKRGYDTGGFEAKEEKDQNKRRLKEVKSSIKDLKIERLKKIGNKRAQTNLKSAISRLKEKKRELKGKKYRYTKEDRKFLKEQNESRVRKRDTKLLKK